jgi:hypothetical protein
MYDGNRPADASPFLLAIVLCLCQATIIEQKGKHQDRLLVLNANPEAQMDPFV